MILVDTSVWIRFLSNREPFATTLDGFLGRDEVIGHEMVYGELLIGDLGGRAKLLAAYAQMRRAPTVPHAEVVEFVRARRLAGRGVGWIDTHLLASAIVASGGHRRVAFWTADLRVGAVAAELGVGFSAS